MQENVYFLERGATRYNLSDKWIITNKGGLGLLTPEYLTKANSQFGERVLSYKLPPRLLSIQLHRRAATSAAQYWRNRAELLELMTPTLSTQLKFVAHLATGERRALDVRYESGAQFEAPDDNTKSSRHIGVTIGLIAHNPTFYSPFAESFNFIATPPSELSFPFDFPKEFDADGGSFDTPDLQYNGNSLFRTYPTMIANGPFTSVAFTNTATGAAIRLDAAVNFGQSRIIALGENERSITDESGNNRFYELDESSNIIDFYIAPNVGASQAISATLTGESGATSLSLFYNARYIGI